MDFQQFLKLGPEPLAAVIAALLGCIMLVGAVYLWMVKSMRRARTNFSDEAQKAIGFARVEAQAQRLRAVVDGALAEFNRHVAQAQLAAVVPSATLPSLPRKPKPEKAASAAKGGNARRG